MRISFVFEYSTMVCVALGFKNPSNWCSRATQRLLSAYPSRYAAASVVCWNRRSILISVSSVGSVVAIYAANRPWAQAYIEQLLCPQDWFSFWRLNCRLASYHALVTGSDGYRQEDKVGRFFVVKEYPRLPPRGGWNARNSDVQLNN